MSIVVDGDMRHVYWAQCAEHVYSEWIVLSEIFLADLHLAVECPLINILTGISQWDILANIGQNKIEFGDPYYLELVIFS